MMPAVEEARVAKAEDGDVEAALEILANFVEIVKEHTPKNGQPIVTGYGPLRAYNVPNEYIAYLAKCFSKLHLPKRDSGARYQHGTKQPDAKAVASALNLITVKHHRPKRSSLEERNKNITIAVISEAEKIRQLRTQSRAARSKRKDEGTPIDVAYKTIAKRYHKTWQSIRSIYQKTYSGEFKKLILAMQRRRREKITRSPPLIT